MTVRTIELEEIEMLDVIDDVMESGGSTQWGATNGGGSMCPCSNPTVCN